MKALILAGGFGTRLRSEVNDLPKSMALVAGRPFLEYQIRLLKEIGIEDVILTVHHMADKIKSYFGEGKRFGVNITYSEEEVPLGTAGAIKRAERYIDDTFLVLNGDSYLEIDFEKFLEFHKTKRSKFSIIASEMQEASRYGRLVVEGNRVIDFLEKSEEPGGLMNAGVYLFEPIIFDYIAPEKNVSLEREIFPKLAKEGMLWYFKNEGYFVDIGLPETYKKFKEEVIKSLFLKEHVKVSDVMKRILRTGVDIGLVVGEDEKLLGVLNDRIIKEHILRGGKIDDVASSVMVRNPITAKHTDSKEKIAEFLFSGINHLPVVDDEGKVKDVQFRLEKMTTEKFPIVRGRAPLRISFAGGGTDIPYFFEKYSGCVINSTIKKYCSATLVKRADKKIIIDSEFGGVIIANSIKDLIYDGKIDLIKAAIKVINPDFGFELYVASDVPPGRGLGSSASLSVLIISLLDQLMELKHDDYTIAKLAHKAEREELKIKGGWQDQYASAIGGFNYMEFEKDKSLVYPLRLKQETIDELENHLLFCYIGRTHNSGEIHNRQEALFTKDESEKIKLLLRLKELSDEIKEALLIGRLELFGRIMSETWDIKKKLSDNVTNPFVDKLYEVALKNGAYGGRLLGAGDGGYLLFFHSPKKRNDLSRALKNAGAPEIMEVRFESDGVKSWISKNRF